MTTVITVQYNDKTRIQKLPDITIDKTKRSDYLIDTSNNSLSLKTSVNDFAGKNDIINKSAAKRYWTEENDLKHTDLRLFSAYKQDKPVEGHPEKKVIFEKFPIVDATPPLTNTELSTTQLLTKANIDEFESYLTKKNQVSYSYMPVCNWENEYTINQTTEEKSFNYTYLSSFNDLMKNIINDSRSTYKFEYTTLSPDKNNVERTTNVVPLNKFKYPMSGSNQIDITSIVHFSVAGIVAVKSDLDDQRSGTIYLEAKEAGNPDDEWRTIDSAVFKFIKNGEPKNDPKYTPGTYVTLNGYLSTKFETRLKLNLKSHGYSMNLYDFRDSNSALVNHYVNTFIGFAHIPSVASTQANKLYFTNINYQSYLYNGYGLQSYVTNLNESYTSKVSTILDKFTGKNISSSRLRISSDPNQLQNASGFKLNGVRFSPTGKIYKLNDPITVEPGMTLYPSYTSGTVQAKRPKDQKINIDSYPSAYNFQTSNLLNRINLTELSVLPNVSWNKLTRIFGKIGANLNATYDTTGEIFIPGSTTKTSINSTDEVSFGNATICASSYATDKPRRQYKEDIYTFNFEKYIPVNKLIPGSKIKCSMRIYPKTWGDGSGNESYGQIRDGQGHVISAVTLKTKNVTKTMTVGLCTGHRWNHSAKEMKISFEQPASCLSFSLHAWADTGKGDGKKKTWFGVYATDIKIEYEYTDTQIDVVDEQHITSGELNTYKGLYNSNANCSIISTNVYPTELKDIGISPENPPSTASYQELKKTTNFQNISALYINYKFVNGNQNYTELTVYPYPQNLVL